LRYLKVEGGSYDALDLEQVLLRHAPLAVIPLFQSFLLMSYQFENFDAIFREDEFSFEQFTLILQSHFKFTSESILELYDSLLVEEGQDLVLKEDLRYVVKSFKSSTETISLKNTGIADFDFMSFKQKRVAIIKKIIATLDQRGLKPIHAFKMAG